ncbi:unnamed protein product [Linum trigynum]|uniref:Uncharacterized protein n=1 Tax=Linum trigynum TaxID=586398 RepID=A0AAV2EPL2_9ROSI
MENDGIVLRGSSSTPLLKGSPPSNCLTTTTSSRTATLGASFFCHLRKKDHHSLMPACADERLREGQGLDFAQIWKSQLEIDFGGGGVWVSDLRQARFDCFCVVGVDVGANCRSEGRWMVGFQPLLKTGLANWRRGRLFLGFKRNKGIASEFR